MCQSNAPSVQVIPQQRTLLVPLAHISFSDWAHSCSLDRETDGQSQRGRAGRRQRYFLAKQVRREYDGGIPRTRYGLLVGVRARISISNVSFSLSRSSCTAMPVKFRFFSRT